jgi:Polyphosphate kinase 2 (PPK2)
MMRKEFEMELAKLQVELTRLQTLVHFTGARIIVLVRGARRAGKGGVISWIVDPLERLEACEKPRANIVRALDRPFDPERLGLLEEGVGRCWGAKTGISRILIATLTETFKQMNRLGPSGRKSLEDALTGMAWDAVREQIEAPSPDEYRDARRTRIKTYIERHIADADLRGHCGVSVRSLHRAFNADPAGSVSNYISRASACSLRGKPAGSRASAPLHHRHLLFLGLQPAPRISAACSRSSSALRRASTGRRPRILRWLDRSPHSRPPRFSGRIEPATTSEARENAKNSNYDCGGIAASSLRKRLELGPVADRQDIGGKLCAL